MAGISGGMAREEESKDEGIPVGRLGRMFRAGWAARHAVPLALRRAVELGSTREGQRGQADEEALAEQRKYAEEIFETLGKLKGMALKVGQMASYLDGVIPPELEPVYQEVLSRLQAAAPTLPPDASRGVIEAELGRPVDQIFARFDDDPLAAASIGQVHRAQLPDGTEVAVKVQYPDVDRAFESDLANLKVLESMFGPLIHYYNSEDALRAAKQNLLDELDYRHELTAQRRMRELFAGDPEIRVPAVFEELSTGKVLTSELVRGRSFEAICRADQEERNHVGRVLMRFNLTTVLCHHFINPDPHPGNYVFHDDGTISFLDFGAAREIDPELSRGLADSVDAAMELDEAAHRRAISGVYGIDDRDPAVFEAYCRVFWAAFDPWKPGNQPFAITPEWLDGYLELMVRESKSVMTRGKGLPKLPPPIDFHDDLVFVERLVAGVGSILARLRATADWRALTTRLLREHGRRA